MKKTLLLSAMILMVVVAVNAQTTIWNFSNAPFGPTPTAPVTFTATFTTADGLTVGTDGTKFWTGLTTSAKTIDGVTYSTRLQCGGDGAPVLPSRIPTTRYFAFNVSGPSTINAGMIASNSSATRTLIIVSADQSYLDSIVNITGAAAATFTYNYTGAAAKIYLYDRMTSGINFYYLSATNVVTTGIGNVFSNKDVTFNGTEITNSKGLSLEVYNVLGKRVASSMTSIPTANFQKGIYIVRASGMNNSLKICI